MNNPLDKLFKERLGDHSIPPPATAWARVESGLSKKNNGLFRFRIAAALLLLSALATSIALLTKRNSPSPAGLTHSIVPKEQSPAKQTSPVKTEDRKVAQVQVPPRKKQSIPATIIVETKIMPVDEKQMLTQTEAPAPDQLLPALENESPIQIAEEVTTAAVSGSTEKPIVIEYRLETVATPPVTNEPQLVATAKEKSGFRKVLDFALDAKNSSPLGDLREQKDKLFAFNKKEKQIVK